MTLAIRWKWYDLMNSSPYPLGPRIKGMAPLYRNVVSRGKRRCTPLSVLVFTPF